MIGRKVGNRGILLFLNGLRPACHLPCQASNSAAVAAIALSWVRS